MEMLNKVELKGFVGSVKVEEVGQMEQARFSVATNYAYKKKDGEIVVETTWHNCTAFREWRDYKAMPFEDLKKGAQVHLTGRIRITNYTSADGVQQSRCDIMVQTLSVEG